jgi:hypothetical protein
MAIAFLTRTLIYVWMLNHNERNCVIELAGITLPLIALVHPQQID